ncbi:hypothetical protein ABZX72_29520 [Streptomyces cyaneofuscatus]|uniref:hypothetical protein n=1 Tax=Streptomyces cyaneofuscatus TaxID=66883 RepID=UPI0033BB2FBC
MAYTWAQRAEDHHAQADQARNKFRDADTALHTAAAGNALQMAEMWARVATALHPAPAAPHLY